jgi:dihydrofolate reductase
MAPIIIVATDAKGGIGIGNTLPWYIHEEMRHFRETTTGHTVVMGRKTHRSIGKVLPNRRNIVLTSAVPDRRNASHTFRGREGLELAHSMQEALTLANTDPMGQTFIIGGAQVYKEAFPYCGRLIVTRIDATFNCDAFFPDIDPAVWEEESVFQKFSEKYGVPFYITHYVRKP